MYIESVPNRNSKPCVLLRESYREGRKVKKRTLANLSKLPEDLIQGIRRLLKGGQVIEDYEEKFEVIRSLPHGHVAAVLETIKKLKLDKIIDSRRSHMRDLSIALIASRIIDPRSKLATARGFRDETAFTSLGEMLDVTDSDEDDLYAAMDWLFARQERIESQLAQQHLQNGSLILYDVTSSYCEGRTCPLAKRGHNRDGKKGKLQIVFGLLCDVEGRPIAVEVFDGNTGDPSTLGTQIEKIRQRFGLDRIILVGDRGMITEARIREELKPVDGLDWITALRAPTIRRLVNEGHLDVSLFDKTDLAEIVSPDFPEERLIVCHNPILAAERRKKRLELLTATEKELEKIITAVKREKKPLRGEKKISSRVGKILNRFKVGKHFLIEITPDSLSYERDELKIAEEAAIDGIYVIRTNVSAKVIDTEKTVTAYKGLSVAERAFRSFKTVDLKVRPIHHRLENRVRAHVFCCMLAYYVEWHMRQSLAPILFDDDDKSEGEKLRSSVVAPAKKSPKALLKASTKRTGHDEPVHSFQTMLTDLATIVKNRIQPKIDGIEPFEKTTIPTDSQKRALDLLDVRI